MGTIEILLPTPPPEADERSEVFDWGRSVKGAKVGLRLDRSWRSYFTVVETWDKMLTERGAEVHTLIVGDRAGPEADKTRDDLDEWSRLVDIGVVGLGN